MEFGEEQIYHAEMSVIGAIVLESKCLPSVADTINPEDFCSPDLGIIYKTILKLSNTGRPIDYVTVLEAVPSVSKEAIGPTQTQRLKGLLLNCCQFVPAISNIEYYADIVHKSALARRLRGVLTTAQMDGITGETVAEDGEKLIGTLSSIIAPMRRKTMVSSKDFFREQTDYYTGKIKKIVNRCDTGYPKIDDFLMGMSGGDLIILAARPKVGKTALALDIADNVAKTDKKVVFYSLEMRNESLMERILARNLGIPMKKLINDNPLFTYDNEKLEEISKNMSDNIIMNDSGDITVQGMRLNCQMIQNLGLIIVDYLQLMRSGYGSNSANSRNLEIGAITRDLKMLAKDLNVPILCLSQLNRMSVDTSRPSSSDLRDSGEIEQNCDKLMLMWCVKKHETFKTIGVDVALNRRGETGVTLLNFHGQNMTFTESSEKYREKSDRQDWRNKSYTKSF